jgi:hypothetical protein
MKTDRVFHPRRRSIRQYRKAGGVNMGQLNQLIALAVTMLIQGCTEAPSNHHFISTGSTMDKAETLVVAPADQGWKQALLTESQIVFEKPERGRSSILGASVFAVEEAESDQRKLFLLEKKKLQENASFTMLSAHFNHVNFKGSPCLQYDGHFEVAGSDPDGGLFLKLRGYECLHPGNHEIAVRMEARQESVSGDFPELTEAWAQAFFDNIQMGRQRR